MRKCFDPDFSHYKQSLRVIDILENDGKGLNLTREVVDGIINHKMSSNPKTLEGKAVSLADRIAYINHDIDDAIVGGFIKKEDLPKDVIEILGDTSSKRINKMVHSIYVESDGKNKVEMEPHVFEATHKLRSFMFERVYTVSALKREEERADRMITTLYEYFKKHENELPEFFIKERLRCDLDTVLCDYISGMSDGFVVKIFNDIFVPKNWKL